MTRLHSVLIKDFKSFRGKHIIGPFSRFTAVIGPNGCGKSNVMDAITFALGEKSPYLRVNKLNQLIHGASLGHPVADKCSVTLVFEVTPEGAGDDVASQGTLVRFKRTVIGSGSEFRINGSVVSKEAYADHLLELGINIQARNFAAYQGEVESIVIKDPKEMTALLEVAAGSHQYKEEYEEKALIVKQAEDEHLIAINKRKCISTQAKETKDEAKEALNYERLRLEVGLQETEYYLFQLYHLQKQVTHLREDVEDKRRHVQIAAKRKADLAKELRQRQKRVDEVTKVVNQIDRQIRDEERKLNQMKPGHIKAAEKVSHSEKKISSLKKKLSDIAKRREQQESKMQTLKVELKQIEGVLADIHSDTRKKESLQGKKLTNGQQKEYEQLKKEADMKTAAKRDQYIASIDRDLNQLVLRTDEETTHKKELMAKLARVSLQKGDLLKRTDNMKQIIRTSEETLKSLKDECASMEKSLASADKDYDKVHKQLDEVTDQLEEMKGDQIDDETRRKKVQVQELLSQRFPGKVFGRFRSICKASHSRYEVAITKVCAFHMDSIVVDSEKTAVECIQVLKNQKLGRETFLPLDGLKVKPLEEKWREDPNVKLLVDCISREGKETLSDRKFTKVVQHVVKSTLVCENDDYASHFASRKKVNIVTLQGNYYQKCGFISGGQASLLEKAKRWKDEEVSVLKARKETLLKKIRVLERQRNSKADLEVKRHQVEGMTKRCRLLADCVQREESDLPVLLKEEEELREEIGRVDESIDKLKRKIDEMKERVVKEEEEIQKIRKHIFKDWCRKTGIADIKEYEESLSQRMQTLSRRRVEAESEMEEVKAKLEFEKNASTADTGEEEKLLQLLQEEESSLEEAKGKVRRKMREIEKQVEMIEGLRAEKASKDVQLRTDEEELKEKTKQLQKASQALSNLESNVTHVEGMISGKIKEQKDIITLCRTSCIKLPLKRGSFTSAPSSHAPSTASSHASTPTSQSTPSTPSSSQASTIIASQQSQLSSQEGEEIGDIDFRRLSRTLKDLPLEEYESQRKKLFSELTAQKESMGRIKHPNFRASEKVDDLNDLLREATTAVAEARQAVKDAREDFEKVRAVRKETFDGFFVKLSDNIDKVYKAIYNNSPDAKAYLIASEEDAFTGGISYSCIPPKKRFHPMANLSGGEKSIAAIALLFAMQSVRHPSPFVLLDEVDVALDNTHLSLLVKYFQRVTPRKIQVIIISHKQELFGHVDSLVGVTSEGATLLVESEGGMEEEVPLPVSKAYVLDISVYEDRQANL